MTRMMQKLALELDTARKIHLAMTGERPYYDEIRDNELKKRYYSSGVMNRNELQQLLERTHDNRLPYKPYRYVYPWVDLQEDGQLKSLYSGRGMSPLEAIEADIRLLEAAVRPGKGANDTPSEPGGGVLEEQPEMQQDAAAAEVEDVVSLAGESLLNCEHVVPQSWFGKQEPMRGDLHHLFACEPGCNSRRGNHPYYDFLDYTPEVSAQDVIAGCGKQEDDRFEPEYGKGIVARATLYFLLRYPGVIDSGHADETLLLEWHRRFPVSLYELHRNLAIFELQGNRNPFIDFPEEAEQWAGIGGN
ncbi:endonuclease I family protein [Paenibacillus durus]|uniref:Endonuclease I n=1 Tax=Paenibacillus durus ATCC 35681 TaxID=1333534 RepID=A0A0F7FDN5_PAEDU|nr:endonuclease [Paenibacillus durus]AKG37055.1 endonuclease I [Paenibacillus durus ATCC 35681]